MRYPELTSEEFISYFSDCYPEMVKEPEYREYFEDMLEQFTDAVDELLQEKLLLDLVSEKPELAGRLSAQDQKRYVTASSRWKTPISVDDLVVNIRKKSPSGNLYDAPIGQLALDELFLMVVYPFSSRMGGIFGYEFAVDGRLGRWLNALRDKDVDEERAEELRVKMREMEERGEYYFREPIEYMPFVVLQELYMAAVNYLSDVRTSSEYSPDNSKRFCALTSLIQDLETAESYGNWVFDDKHKGTPDDPKRMPYLRYSALVDRVYENTNHIVATLPHGDELQIAEIYLSSIGIDYRHIEDLDVSEHDEYCILALLRHIYAYERFGDGYINHFFHNGCVLKWIKRLKEIDDDLS